MITGLAASLDASGQSKVLLHRQLFERLKQAILSGQFKPGSRLPSTRSLAAELNIARNTLLIAYELLVAEGLAEARVGRGTIVKAMPEIHLKISPRSFPRRGGIPLHAAEHTAGNEPFKVGAPAYDRFPFRIWNDIVGRCARAQGVNDLAYQNPLGHAGLRKLLAAYLLTRRGLRCDVDQIFIVPGYQAALSLVVRTLLSSGESAWTEDPGHRSTREALSCMGINTVPVPADENGLDVDTGIAMAPDANLAVVTPAHQFPLGVALSAGRRRKLIAWAVSGDRWIVEDDYDTEFHFAGRPPDALAAASPEGHVIYTGTFSKVLYPSLRIGYVVAPPALAARFSRVRAAFDGHQPLLMQDVVRRFIEEGHFDRHLRRMRALYRERQLELIDAIESRTGGRLRPLTTSGGTHMTFLFESDVDDLAFADIAGKLGVKVTPLTSVATNHGRTGLVLGFSNCSSSALADAMKKLGKTLAAPFPKRVAETLD